MSVLFHLPKIIFDRFNKEQKTELSKDRQKRIDATSRERGELLRDGELEAEDFSKMLRKSDIQYRGEVTNHVAECRLI